jgi:hypothetical protein
MQYACVQFSMSKNENTTSYRYIAYHLMTHDASSILRAMKVQEFNLDLQHSSIVVSSTVPVGLQAFAVLLLPRLRHMALL